MKSTIKNNEDIANSNAMYTKLIVRFDGQDIEFYSHELVKIAFIICKNLENEIYIDKYISIDKYDKIHKSDTCFIPDAKLINTLMQFSVDRGLANFMISPIPILGMNSISSWHSAVMHFRELYSKKNHKLQTSNKFCNKPLDKSTLIQKIIQKICLFTEQNSEDVNNVLTLFMEQIFRENANLFNQDMDDILSKVVMYFFKVSNNKAISQDDETSSPESNDQRFSVEIKEFSSKLCRKIFTESPHLFVSFGEEETVKDIFPEIAKKIFLETSSQLTDSDFFTGRWMLIGGRMLLIKTLDDKSFNEGHFYISDHGRYSDLLDNTREIALTSEKFDYVSFPKILGLIKEFSGESDDSLNSFFYDMMLTVAQTQWDMSDEEKRYIKILLDRFTEIKQKSQTHIKLYKVLKQKYSNLLDKLEQKREEFFELIKAFPNECREFPQETTEMQFLKGSLKGIIEFSKDKGFILDIYTDEYVQYIRDRIAVEITQDTNYGDRLGILRTDNSFGELSAETYRKFAMTFQNYFAQSNSYSAAEIAHLMRCILSGGEINEDELNFLPNLVAAWFLGEPIRNDVCILTGLMLLDLIESNVQLMDSQGRNLYNWQYTLIHPDKLPKEIEKPLRFKDLYGDELAKFNKDKSFKKGKDGDGLGKFDGSHPMVHGEAVSQSKVTIGSGQKLTAVRQKEGSIIIDWLSKILEQVFGLACKTLNAYNSPLSTPNYDILDKLLQNPQDPSRSIKKDPMQLAKWDLLHNFIIPCLKTRLVTLDNLLDNKKLAKGGDTEWVSGDEISVIGYALNNDSLLSFTPTVNPYLPITANGSLERFISESVTTGSTNIAAAINITPNFIHQAEGTHWVLYFAIRSGDHVKGVLLNPMGQTMYDESIDSIVTRISTTYREQGIENININSRHLGLQTDSFNCGVWVLKFLELINELLLQRNNDPEYFKGTNDELLQTDKSLLRKLNIDVNQIRFESINDDLLEYATIDELLQRVYKLNIDINQIRTEYRNLYEASVSSQQTTGINNIEDISGINNLAQTASFTTSTESEVSNMLASHEENTQNTITKSYDTNLVNQNIKCIHTILYNSHNPILRQDELLYQAGQFAGMDGINRLINLGEQDDDVARRIITATRDYGISQVLNILMSDIKTNPLTNAMVVNPDIANTNINIDQITMPENTSWVDRCDTEDRTRSCGM